MCAGRTGPAAVSTFAAPFYAVPPGTGAVARWLRPQTPWQRGVPDPGNFLTLGVVWFGSSET